MGEILITDNKLIIKDFCMLFRLNKPLYDITLVTSPGPGIYIDQPQH